MKIISFPAQLSGIKSRKDRTWRVELDTSELGEDAAQLVDIIMNEVQVVISEQEITMKDIPEVKGDSGIKEKSPSQRLRASLYVFWEQQGKQQDWELFYLKQMNRLIDLVKEKLE